MFSQLTPATTLKILFIWTVLSSLAALVPAKWKLAQWIQWILIDFRSMFVTPTPSVPLLPPQPTVIVTPPATPAALGEQSPSQPGSDAPGK